MLNIIKMDLYRLVRSKSFYVMIICAVMMAVACVAMSSVARVRMVDTTIEEGEELHEIKIMRKINSSKQVNLLIYYQAFVEKCYLLPLVSIFVALFVNGENKSGYIKSVAVQLPGRGKLAISKVIIAAIQTAVIMLAYTIIYFIGMKLVFGE